MSNDCIFCKIVNGDIPCSRIYEDDDALAFMDINPFSHGHSLIIPKAHYSQLHECPEELLGKVLSKAGKVAKAIQKATGCSGYNLLNNNGSDAGQEVGHIHLHIIPRYASDSVITIKHGNSYPEGRMQELQELIKLSYRR